MFSLAEIHIYFPGCLEFIHILGCLDKVGHKGNIGNSRPRDHQQRPSGHHSQWQGIYHEKNQFDQIKWIYTWEKCFERQNKHKNLMKDTWTLTLKNVQTGDRGPYMCQVRLFAEFWVLIWFPNFFYWVTKNCLFLLMIISTGELDACEKSSGPLGGL